MICGAVAKKMLMALFYFAIIVLIYRASALRPVSDLSLSRVSPATFPVVSRESNKKTKIQWIEHISFMSLVTFFFSAPSGN